MTRASSGPASRILNRVRGARTVGLRHSARQIVSDAKLRLRSERRERAAAELARAHTPAEVLAFVAANVPGGAVQRPAEILPFLDLVRERRPQVVLEIGVAYGGTNVMLGATLPSVTELVGLDVFVLNRPLLETLGRAGLRRHLVEGDSRSPATFARIRELLAGRTIDLLFIDGDHSFAGVVGDFRLYSGLVKPGGLIAFHDIVADLWLRQGTGLPYVGQAPIVWEILRAQYQHHEFVESYDQEGMGIGVIEYDPDVQFHAWPLTETSDAAES